MFCRLFIVVVLTLGYWTDCLLKTACLMYAILWLKARRAIKRRVYRLPEFDMLATCADIDREADISTTDVIDDPNVQNVHNSNSGVDVDIQRRQNDKLENVLYERAKEYDHNPIQYRMDQNIDIGIETDVASDAQISIDYEDVLNENDEESYVCNKNQHHTDDHIHSNNEAELSSQTQHGVDCDGVPNKRDVGYIGNPCQDRMDEKIDIYTETDVARETQYNVDYDDVLDGTDTVYFDNPSQDHMVDNIDNYTETGVARQRQHDTDCNGDICERGEEYIGNPSQDRMAETIDNSAETDLDSDTQYTVDYDDVLKESDEVYIDNQSLDSMDENMDIETDKVKYVWNPKHVRTDANMVSYTKTDVASLTQHGVDCDGVLNELDEGYIGNLCQYRIDNNIDSYAETDVVSLTQHGVDCTGVLNELHEGYIGNLCQDRMDNNIDSYNETDAASQTQHGVLCDGALNEWDEGYIGNLCQNRMARNIDNCAETDLDSETQYTVACDDVLYESGEVYIKNQSQDSMDENIDIDTDKVKYVFNPKHVRTEENMVSYTETDVASQTQHDVDCEGALHERDEGYIHNPNQDRMDENIDMHTETGVASLTQHGVDCDSGLNEWNEGYIGNSSQDCMDDNIYSNTETDVASLTQHGLDCDGVIIERDEGYIGNPSQTCMDDNIDSYTDIDVASQTSHGVDCDGGLHEWNEGYICNPSQDRMDEKIDIYTETDGARETQYNVDYNDVLNGTDTVYFDNPSQDHMVDSIDSYTETGVARQRHNERDEVYIRNPIQYFMDENTDIDTEADITRQTQHTVHCDDVLNQSKAEYVCNTSQDRTDINIDNEADMVSQTQKSVACDDVHYDRDLEDVSEHNQDNVNVNEDIENEIDVSIKTQRTSIDCDHVRDIRGEEYAYNSDQHHTEENIDIDTVAIVSVQTHNSLDCDDIVVENNYHHHMDDIDSKADAANLTQESAVCNVILNRRENIRPPFQRGVVGNEDIGTESDINVSTLSQQAGMCEDLSNERDGCIVGNVTEQCVEGHTYTDIVKEVNSVVQHIEGDTYIDNNVHMSLVNELCNKDHGNVGDDLPTSSPDKSTNIACDQVAGRGCIYVNIFDYEEVDNHEDEYDQGVEGDQVDDGTEREHLMEQSPDTNSSHVDFDTSIDYIKTNRNASIGSESTLASASSTQSFCQRYINKYTLRLNEHKFQMKCFDPGNYSSDGNALYEKINRRFDCKWNTKMKYIPNIYRTDIGPHEKQTKCDLYPWLGTYLPNMNTVLEVYLLDDTVRENNQQNQLQADMQREWSRFVSFSCYEGRGNTFKLARHGFFHNTDNGRTWTTCFFCGRGRGDWELGDNVVDLHPECILYSGTSNNIPIQEVDSQNQATIHGDHVHNQTATGNDVALYSASTRRGPMGVFLRQPSDGALPTPNIQHRVVRTNPNQTVSERRQHCHVVDWTFLQGDFQGPQPPGTDGRASVRNIQQDGHLGCEHEQREEIYGNLQDDARGQTNPDIADPMQGPVIDLLNYTVELKGPFERTPQRAILPRPEFLFHRHVNRQADQQGSRQSGSYNQTCIVCGEGPAMFQPCGHFGCCTKCQLVCPHCANYTQLF